MGYYYEYRVKGLQKVSAQVAGEFCEELRNSEEGLTPSSLLNASRDEKAPLHNEFEWDDMKAAEGYRLGQARGIIQNLRLTITQSGGEVITERAFISIERGTTEYVPMKIVVKNDDMMAKMLKQARADCRAFIEKYSRCEKLKAVSDAMKEFLSAS